MRSAPAPRLRDRIKWYHVAAVVIVVLAGILRCTHLGWDDLNSYHPDERNITTASERIGFENVRLDPDSSLNPHFFAYGSLPLYLIKVAAVASGQDRPGGHLLVARSLSAAFGTLSVALTLIIGWRVWNRTVGLLGALFLTLAVLHIQTAHFGTVDNLLTTLLLLATLASLEIARSGGWLAFLGAGAVIGAALATKMSALSFVVLPVGACALAVLIRGAPLGRTTTRLLAAGALALATAFVLAPYQWLDAATFAQSIVYEKQVVDGTRDVFYTRQFAGTPAVLFQIQQLVRHTMGPPLSLLCVVGLGFVLVHTWAGAWRQARDRPSGPLTSQSAAHRARVNVAGDRVLQPPWGPLLLLLWFVPYAAIIGSWWAKFIRYTVPLFPFACLFAAAWAAWAWRSTAAQERRHELVGLAVVATVLYSLVYALGWFCMYRTPHPWTAASRWFHAGVPAGSVVASEFADHRLPVALGEGDDVEYHRLVIDVYSPDDLDKAHRMASVLSQADYFVIASKRGYGTVIRQGRYPMASSFYRQLISGVLGYELEVSFERRPALGPLVWPDLAAEETFRVFDHPTVRVFRNAATLSAQALERLLLFPYYECARMTDDDLLHARAVPLSLSAASIVELLRAAGSTDNGANAFQGGQGARPGQYSEPRGIAVDPEGRIWVADSMNHRLQVLTSNGVVVDVIGEPGSEPGQFNQPSGVAVSDDWVFVADTWNWRIQALSRTSDEVVVFPHSFYGPRHVVVDGDELYIADTGNHRIVVCSFDGSWRREWGRFGTNPGELNEPVGMAVVGDEIVVADTLNQRLQVFSTDGELRRWWPLYADLEDRSNYTVEHHVAWHQPTGQLVVTDPRGHKVLLFTVDGTPRGELEGHVFFEPTGVAAASDGTLYFTEMLQNSVVPWKIGLSR